MEFEVIETKNAPAAFGPFCQAIKSKDFLFTSGILPYFSEPYPARGAIGVNELAKNARIEIQVIAVYP